MDQERIGNFIKNLRVKNNLTQKQFAEMLGVTYQAVSKWETGKNIPDIVLLQEISNIFKVDINEILKGEQVCQSFPKKSKKGFIILLLLLMFIVVNMIIYIICCNSDSSFEFRTLTTTCDEFTLKGSVAYSKEKFSIYISDIDYCGQQNNIIYQKIECTLYESYRNIKTEIIACPTNTIPETLSDFLQDVEFSIDNYIASCKHFSDSDLYLEVLATNKENQTISYKIPIQLENCNTK